MGDSIIKHVLIKNGSTICYRGITANQLCGNIRRMEDISHSPRTVFINVGTNDLSRNGCPDKVMGAMSNVIKFVKKKLPKAQIIINSIRHMVYNTAPHKPKYSVAVQEPWGCVSKLGKIHYGCLSLKGWSSFKSKRHVHVKQNIYAGCVSMRQHLVKTTGPNSHGSLESHDQTANGKTDNYENFNEEASVLPPDQINHLSLQESPPTLTPALATVYSWMIIVMRHLAALYLVSTTNECQKVVNDTVLSVPQFVPQVPVSEDCNEDKSNSSSVFLDNRHVKLIPVQKDVSEIN
ncbi:hypothetical protein J6590_049142 [Homalodisca vitripennis]|nr:hypothetical protein J6590_049142 [Homalodisca vitripennis]